MKILIIIIFTISVISGCQPKNNELEYTYLEIYRNNYIDTMKWFLSKDFITQTDSFYHITGIDYRKNEKDSFNIGLPKTNDSFTEYANHLSDTLNLNFEGEEFSVFKYESGRTIGDGLMFTYFEPSIGVLIIKSANWGTYVRLIETGDKKLDKKVFFLNDRIISNNEFFNER